MEIPDQRQIRNRSPGISQRSHLPDGRKDDGYTSPFQIGRRSSVVEQLFRKQQVVRSNRIVGSNFCTKIGEISIVMKNAGLFLIFSFCITFGCRTEEPNVPKPSAKITGDLEVAAFKGGYGIDFYENAAKEFE